MSNPNKLNLFTRAVLIYIITILVGTFIDSLFLGMGSIWQLFAIGLMITGAVSSPNILLLFIGFIIIYRRNEYTTNIRAELIILATLICILPILLYFGGSFFGKMGATDFFGMIFLTIPYIITAYISILGINYYFDKKDFKFDFFQKEKKKKQQEGLEDILDDNLDDF